jgi:plastocyanin
MKMSQLPVLCASAVFAVVVTTAGAAPTLAADVTTVNVTLKDHAFSPAEIHVPAGKPAELVIKNEDSQAEEFDSSALKAEKVIAAGQTATIKLRPLKAGRYDFTGEYHEDTAKGVVIAE